MTPSLALLAITAYAATPEPPPPPQIPFEKYELANGLDVILAPDPSTPIVHVNVWYHVGSKDETQGLTGFAHLFEHLMFQGSASQPTDYFKALENIGASEMNGTTSFDRTNYYETVPAEALKVALFLESDRMGWLLDVLDQAKLDNQREVVRNERRQRYENPPYGEAFKTLFATLWPEGHPYNHMPIGSHEDLQAADLAAVKTFFTQWYAPNNASLVICGDFETREAKQLVEHYFGGIRSSSVPAKASAAPVELREPKVVRQYQKVPEQKVWLAWVSPGAFAEGDADLDLLSTVLTDGKDSRLYHRLVKDLRIAKDISASQMSLGLGSAYIIQATAAKGHTTDEVVSAIDAVLAEVTGEKPPTIQELESARAQYEVGFYQAISTIASKADLLNNYNFRTGNPGYLAADLARYGAATPETVFATAKKILGKPRVALHIVPESERPAEATP
jgi:zinc protease